MAKVLKAAGSGLESVVKANLYMRELDRDFGPMNEIYVQVRLSLTFQLPLHTVLFL